MNRKNLGIVLVAVVIVGAAGYFTFVKKPELVEQQPVLTETPVSPTIIPEDETANWGTYNFNGPEDFSIKYPSSWIRTETHAGDYAASLSLARGSYGIHIGQADGEGGYCFFSDSKEKFNEDFNESFDIDLRNVPFVEMDTPIGVLRRYPTKATIGAGLEIDFAFCSKLPDGRFTGAGVYSTPVGGITYEVPPNYDPQVLAEMDAIIKTIEE